MIPIPNTAFAALALAAACAAGAVQAAGGAAAPESVLKLYLDRATTGLPGRAEVSVGALDTRVDLSACSRLEPFLPPGKQLWGRTWVGVRCMEGPPLTAYFPVHVRIYGSALVAARPLTSGMEPAAEDFRLEEVELTREAPGVLTGFAPVSGRVLGRPLAAGQPARPEYFRARPAVAIGDNVKLVYAGEGFSVSTDGRALGAAAEGQPVRVQTSGGRIMTGTARRGRIVQVSF